MRYYVTLGAAGHVTLWHVVDTERDLVVASWGSRTAAEADASMRNRRRAALA